MKCRNDNISAKAEHLKEAENPRTEFPMILSCHNISKSFGTEEVLKEVSFHIEEHEKAAIVGINGAGKSTLLKIIIGEMEPDSGEVTSARDATIGYLAQQNMLSGSRTIYEEVAEVKKDVIELEQSLRDMEKRMNTVAPDELNSLMDEYHRAEIRFEREDGYAWKSEISGVLNGLGFSEEEWDKPVSTLSGGQKTRVALGRLLLSAPDIMLLDEPINHLDINSIAWLENYLINYRGAVIVVAHDRYFLNRVAGKIIELDNGKAMTFTGNYSAYAEKKKQLRDAQLKAYMNQQAEIRHQEEVISKLRSFNREKSIKRAESHEKMLNRIERLEKPVELNAEMRLSLNPRIVSGNDVLMIEDLSKSFEFPLFSGLNLEIKRGERVALIGNNGTGKSTLLKCMIGLQEPDSGTIRLGTKVHIGYYDQEHQVLHPEKTLFEELSDAYPAMTNTEVRNVLASFLFTGDDVYKQVKDLSGGERGRLSLARLMLSEANFLILDEPTNHLDIISKEILEDAILRYTGTVLFVSHDRYFINRIATRVLDLTNRTLVNYLGNYDYYLEKREELTEKFASGRDGLTHGSGGSISVNSRHLSMTGTHPGAHQDAAAVPEAAGIQAAGSQAAGASSPSGSADWKKQKEEAAKQRKKENELKQTETEISSLEARDREIDDLLAKEEIFSDVSKVTELSKEKADIADRLEELYARWEELAE